MATTGVMVTWEKTIVLVSTKGETTKDGTMIREIQYIPSIYTDQDSCSLDSLYRI